MNPVSNLLMTTQRPVSMTMKDTEPPASTRPSKYPATSLSAKLTPPDNGELLVTATTKDVSLSAESKEGIIITITAMTGSPALIYICLMLPLRIQTLAYGAI